MYYRLSLKMVPVRIETLGEFSATNPWNGNRGDKWTVNLYELASETLVSAVHWKNMRRGQAQTVDASVRRSEVQSRKLKMRQTIGFESSDGRMHMLPRMLVDLWRAGEVPDASLPALLKEFEPTLKRSDFKMNRRRLVFKVEAVMLLIFGIAALAALLVDRIPSHPAHRQIELTQAAWLGLPMSEQAISASGDGVKLDGAVRLREGLIQTPPALNTYGNLDLMGWFKAQNENRLVLLDGNGFQPRNGVPELKIALRGVVLPANNLGLSPRVMELFAQKIPQLNKDFVLVSNADWGDQGGVLQLGEMSPVLGWAGACLMLPFAAFLICSGLWRRRDARMKERFRSALTQSGFGGGIGSSNLHTQESVFRSC